MNYKVSGHPRITVRLPIGAVVISLKELINTGLTTAVAALFSTAAEQAEYLRHIGSWTAVEGYVEHGSPAVPASVFLMTDFRAKNADGTGNYPSTANMASYGVELKTNGSRHYFNNIDTDRVLVYCATGACTLAIDLAFEV